MTPAPNDRDPAANLDPGRATATPPLTARAIVDLLGLVSLEREGGYFRETYRSTEAIEPPSLPARYRSRKSLSTCIYYLLTPEAFSAIHRIPSDEIFHFYLGDAVEMLHLLPGGMSRHLIMGHDIRSGQLPQIVVPMGVWQGCRLLPGGSWALLGTTVAPGFDFDDYEHGDLDALVREYSKEAELIRALLAGRR